jgi:hypothetical protein
MAGVNQVHPVRVLGRIEQAPHGLRLVAVTFKEIDWPKPERLASANDLLVDRPRWHDRYVEVEDQYLVGFEASVLGGSAWLTYHPGVKEHCAPSRPEAMISGAKWLACGSRVRAYAPPLRSHGHARGGDRRERRHVHRPGARLQMS